MLIGRLLSKNRFQNWHLTVSKEFYFESFPLIQRKESKHVTPVEPWITQALLVLRRTKNS